MGISWVMARTCDQKKYCAMQGDNDDGNDEKDNEGQQWVLGRMTRKIERDNKVP
jgi:hypothetical protein